MPNQKKRLLIVEDDTGLRDQLRWSFSDYDVKVASNRNEALAQLRRFEPPVVTLDLGLPPDENGATEGLATLESILDLIPATKVIMVTGNGDQENAVRSIALGAYDFYEKPVDADILKLIIDRAWQLYHLEEANRNLSLENSPTPLPGMISASPEMTEVCRIIEKVAQTEVTTLILGESGTGKEVIARAIHQLSPRAKHRFVAVNCAAIPETLLESELFGYEKGAFTGANKMTPGKIEHAEGGTFFLDEIGDLPVSLQAKLLRFLEQRTIERLGGRSEIPVDIRVICATHQDLEAHVQEGRFREDLYYRVCEFPITLPPLRDREGDATLLAHVFLKQFCRQHGLKETLTFEEDALAALSSYHWPGNIRELKNKMMRASMMATGNTVKATDLNIPLPETDVATETQPLNLREVRDQAEIHAVRRALIESNQNITEAAKSLGISRPTLYALMEKHHLNPSQPTSRQ